MRLASAYRTQLVPALREDADLDALVNAVHEAPPDIANAPWLLLGEFRSSPWRARGFTGEDARFATTAFVRARDPERGSAITEAAATIIEAMPAELEGARIVLVQRLATRSGRDGRSGWAFHTEWRVLLESD